MSAVGQLLENIGHDMRTIASDELEMGRTALVDRFEAIILRIAVTLLAVIVGLVGFGMLCVTAVFALHGLIASLWLRMLIMSIVYIVVGGIAASIVSRRITRSDGDIQHQIDEAHDTVNAIKRGLAK
jgi:hypothetical protein